MLPADNLQSADDSMEFRSCLTLIAEVASDERGLRQALDCFYGGTPDAATPRLPGRMDLEGRQR
jgi:uncharacterized protein (DUF1810 family)